MTTSPETSSPNTPALTSTADDDAVDSLLQDARLQEERERLMAKYGKSLSKQMLRKKLQTKVH
jgi:hypothetical protein